MNKNKKGGKKFIAVPKKKDTIGLQFHPEWSGLIGLKLFKSFLINWEN